MPHDDSLRGSAADWLRHARSDKAVLIAKGLAPPRTHNIRTLLDLLPPAIVSSDNLQNAAGLTDYAVMSRYPAEIEPVSEEEYREAVGLAETVLTWAEGQI